MPPQNGLTLPFISRSQLHFEHGNAFSLELEYMANVASEILIVGYTREGIFKFADTHTGNSTIDTTTFRIPDIPIQLSVHTITGTVERGEVWATLFLTINGERVAKLCSGYVSRQQSLTYPVQVIPSNFERPGIVRSITGTDQAANTEISETVPVNVAWLVHSFTYTLVTDATAATRSSNLQITDGTNIVMQFHCQGTQTASDTKRYHWIRKGSREDASSDGTRLGDLPLDIILPAGFVIQTTTNNRQTGDNYGAPQILVEEFRVATS